MKKLLSFLLILVLGLFMVGCETSNNPSNENDPNTENNTNQNQNNGNENNPNGNENNGNEDDPNGNQNNGNENNNDDDEVITITIKTNSKVVYSDSFMNYELKYSLNEVEKKKEEVLDNIKKATELSELNAIYDDYSNYYKTLEERYIVVEGLYDADNSNEAVVTGYYDLYKLMLDGNLVFDDIDKEIAEGSLAHAYFEGYTDEEIEAIINNENTDEELNKLLMRKEEIKEEIRDSSGSKKNALLEEFVSINKQIVTFVDYDKYEYIEYSDCNDYFRLYSKEDVKVIEQYALQYLLDLDNELYYSDYEPVDEDEYEYAYELQYSSFTDFQDLIKDYATFIGGDFLDYYNGLFNGGYYIICNDRDNGTSTAYQDAGGDVKFVFFGPYYQDSSTFVHEFGHYFTSNLGSDNYSYDLCEVHSQADEALFRLYLLSLDNSDVYKWYEKEFVNLMLDTIIIGLMVREFEETIYASDVESLQDTWDAINEKYDFFSSDDFYDLITDYDNYYISYVTSAICALELYAYGKTEGLEKAKEAYLAICGYNGEGDIEEAMTNAGISDPFGEETILNLVSVITYEMENNWK